MTAAETGCFHYRLSPSTVALVTLITPVFALLLGSWLNGEVVGATTWAGTAVILTGLSCFFWGGRLRSPLPSRV